MVQDYFLYDSQDGHSFGKFILLTKITPEQKEVALSYHRERGLYFLIDIFEAYTVSIPLDSLFFLWQRKRP